jgi:hypothetical protein
LVLGAGFVNFSDSEVGAGRCQMSPWVIMTVYMNTAGVLVTGKVVEKREAILMPGVDSWEHIPEVRYSIGLSTRRTGKLLSIEWTHR